MINNDGNNPIFTTKSGIELKLRRIRGIIMDRFNADYQKKYAPPKPPKVQLANGDWWDDVNDEQYKRAFGQWNQLYATAIMDFMLTAGISNQPPDDWTSDYPYMDVTTPKLVWLAELLDENELQELAEAISSLSNPTEAAIQESEKK